MQAQQPSGLPVRKTPVVIRGSATLALPPHYHRDASDDPEPVPLPPAMIPMTSKTATRLLYLAFGLFIVASMTYFVMQTTAVFQELTHRGEHARMPFQVDDDLFTISNLEHEALAAGFKPGDRLLEVRGEPYRNRRQIVALTGGGKDFVHAGSPLSMVVRRVDGTEYHAQIHTTAAKASQKTFNFEWGLNLLQL